MTYSAECQCDKCKNVISANAEVYCFWCVEELNQTIAELREIISALERKDAVASGR